LKMLIELSEKDNVLTCTTAIRKGETFDYAGGIITAADNIPIYHKIANMFIKAGEKVFKYGEAIGIAVVDIHPGEHVHIHNLEGARGRGDKKRD
jgi:altronate dehydratase small subunit